MRHWENKINNDKNIWIRINIIGADIERENMAVTIRYIYIYIRIHRSPVHCVIVQGETGRTRHMQNYVERKPGNE
jgi:hypothetical protein